MIALDIRDTRIYLRGDTYPAKDRIKAAGGHWDADEKAWWVGKTHQKLAEMEALCATAPAPQPRVEGKCSDCGKTCKVPYTLCWDCKQKRDARAGTRKCTTCGAQEGKRNARGYIDGTRLMRSGECFDCWEERKMGY
jgi:hypothetical protein